MGTGSWDSLHGALARADVGGLETDLALILGAGVSYGCGFPDWDSFVSKLAREAETRLGRPRLDRGALTSLRDGGWSLPRITTFIRTAHRLEEQQWAEVVREALYAEVDGAVGCSFRTLAEASERSKVDCPEIVGAVGRVNPSLAAIVEVCSLRRKTKWIVEPRVGAVLTYNVDALLQVYDRARHGTPRLFRTIERSSKRRKPGKIPLYHLHGYLRPYATHGETKDSLILGEQDYHERTDDPYSFATSTTLWALREFTCLFVGCSMKDELMRRALFRAEREHERALRAETGSSTSHSELPRHYAVLEKTDDRQADFIERDLAVLGVRPVWVADFEDDLPRQLRALARTLRS